MLLRVSNCLPCFRYVCLFFYPLDFTFVCPSEIIAFDKALDKFAEKNCEVIGVSVDSHFCHFAWRNTPVKQVRLCGCVITDVLSRNENGVVSTRFCCCNTSRVFCVQGGIGPIKYPLVSDLSKKISKDYGVGVKNHFFQSSSYFLPR